jgi:hypothetical protein
MAKKAVAGNGPQMKEEGLFEYHLYTLDHPTTIQAEQTKQVALLSATSVPVRKQYLLKGDSSYYQGAFSDTGEREKVGVYLLFDNKEASSLGMPLPAGTVRVFKGDAEGRAQFVGEDAIGHTPRNEEVRLKLGDAFDLTARRKQTEFRSLGSMGQWHNVFESAFEVELRNAKDEPVTIRVLEPVYGDWEMVDKNQPFTRDAAGLARFDVDVPGGGSATLKYRVRTRW